MDASTKILHTRAGFVAGFVVGGVAGLVIGLFAYPPTAWFAVLELGIPVSLLGAGCGVVTGAISDARRSRRASG